MTDLSLKTDPGLSSAGPLEDLRVVAVEQFGAGPWASLQLADLGAQVIKVEDPASGGDVARYVPPYQAGEDSLYFETFNRSKLSVSLDLRTPGGRAAFRDLVARSDVVFSNVRGDQAERLGLTYAQLESVNPRVVCCALSAFGRTGPRGADPGYDPVIQALSGWMSLTGEPASPPAKTGLSLVDFAAGYVSVIAMLAGVAQARRTGRGCDCDVSLFETALAQLTYIGTWVATAGFAPRRQAMSAHPSIVPFQAFPTADGWITVACAKEKFWRRLCDAIGRPGLAADPRFSDFAARDVHREELVPALCERFRERPSREWIEILQRFGVPSGQVNDVAGALSDPQVAAREAIVELDHPRLGRIRQVASPMRVGESRPAPRPGPARGEHTDSVLLAICDYTPERLNELWAEGAFGPTADRFANRDAAKEAEPHFQLIHQSYSKTR